MDNFMHMFSWVFVALSLTGNIFIIKKNVIGQWFWAVSNIGWISFNLYIGVYSQAFLFSVYFCLCVWAIISWTKADRAAQKSMT